ncbi:uncharacterized protein LOC123867453 [Maniola jurtina]|uniref:uncharacterized protein LOC123867453 n=1 Tax=Maniola jurtina TaxID=191418 RepID=UPI001E68B8A6|nr:uncharacterized protein LOC123867453 [Maniola jurtina]
MKYITKLLDSINRCFIPKLSKNYDEIEVKNHVEFDLRNNNLDHNFELLVQCLGDLMLSENKEASTVISSLYILYKELQCECPWNNEKTKDYAKKLNIYFEVLGELPLEVVLLQKSNFDVQEIFDKCLEALHSKLTSEDFKKYPSLIEVFCLILADLMKYSVKVKPQRVFPVSLLLIDDYIETNKRKGLSCCLAALQCMKLEDFDGGNYYEVVYRSLKRTFLEKDIKITALTHACLIELCRIFPADIKHDKMDDMYSGILDQIITESNIYRKAECLKFTQFIVQTHKINCVSRNSFKMIICDCLDLCTNEMVANVLLVNTLECLDEWIIHCWCIWKLSSDYKIISTLLKILYTCQRVYIASRVQRLIIILICLCKDSEQKQLIANLEKANTIDNDVFKKRVEEIRQEFIS